MSGMGSPTPNFGATSITRETAVNATEPIKTSCAGTAQRPSSELHADRREHLSAHGSRRRHRLG